jgi:branched-chain amino acid transport system ATP-binding protein
MLFPRILEVGMLKVSNFSGGYSKGLAILNNVSFDLGAGSVTSIVGSNGAGKTSLLRGICGLLPWHRGEIHFNSYRIDGLTTATIARLGIRMVPSNRGTFTSMTVTENLQTAGYGLRRTVIASRIEREFDRFPRLRDRHRQQAGTLSGGEQQMLAIARAMMADPSMLILDEPSQGLAPIIIDQLFALIPQLAAQNVRILLVEQDVGRSLEFSENAFVMEKGTIGISGRSDYLIHDQRIKQLYLGCL